MASRMDKYNSKESLSRADRNTNLYDTLYSETEYSITTMEKTLNKTNEVNLDVIKAMIKEEKKYENKIVELPKEIIEDEEKNYDINEVLNQAKSTYRDDNTTRTLKETPYEIKEKLQRQKEIPEVVDIKQSDGTLDMFADLKGTSTINDGDIKELIEDEKAELEEPQQFTVTMGINDSDFDELKDMKDVVKNNNILLKVLLGFLIFVALLATSYAIYRIIR